MTAPRRRELALAREVAEIVIVETALAVLDDVLAHEHPCLDDLGENDPPELRAARRLRAAARGLRAELRRYRLVLRAERYARAFEHDEEDLPF